MKRGTLLGVDAAVNLLLGALLVAFPAQLVSLLGMPLTDSSFYPTILGGVLVGIGLALLIEVGSHSDRAVGLGLIGALTINLCGGMVLAVWLVAGGLGVPARGLITLWLLVVVLVGLSGLELVGHLRRDRSEQAV